MNGFTISHKELPDLLMYGFFISTNLTDGYYYHANGTESDRYVSEAK
jgi:hypothetical protein